MVHNIQKKHSCGVSTNAERSHLENYRNEEVSKSKVPAVIENQVSFKILLFAYYTEFINGGPLG